MHTLEYALNILSVESPSKLYETTHPDWIPSRNLGHREFEKIELDGTRYSRAAERGVKRRLQENNTTTSIDTESGTAVQTTLTMCDITNVEERLVQMEDEQASIRSELEVVKIKMNQSNLEEDAFSNNDEKVAFYTGLPNWKVLSVLLEYLESNLLLYSSLSPFQQLLMTLMRLRLNLSGQDLAYRFRVHKSTISPSIFLCS